MYLPPFLSSEAVRRTQVIGGSQSNVNLKPCSIMKQSRHQQYRIDRTLSTYFGIFSAPMTVSPRRTQAHSTVNTSLNLHTSTRIAFGADIAPRSRRMPCTKATQPCGIENPLQCQIVQDHHGLVVRALSHCVNAGRELVAHSFLSAAFVSVFEMPDQDQTRHHSMQLMVTMSQFRKKPLLVLYHSVTSPV